MNGLSYFGLNFLVLGAGSAYVFSFKLPLVLLSVLFFSLGFIMLYDDSRKQPWGGKVLSYFPGTHKDDVKRARIENDTEKKDAIKE